MRRMMMWATMGGTMVALAGCLQILPQTLPTASEEREILAAVQAMEAAAGRRDAEALHAWVLDEPNPIVENGLLRRTRGESLQATRSGFEGIAAISYRFAQRQITMLAPGCALCVSEGTTRATLNDGRVLERPVVQSLILEKRPEGWRVRHGHLSTPGAR